MLYVWWYSLIKTLRWCDNWQRICSKSWSEHTTITNMPTAVRKHTHVVTHCTMMPHNNRIKTSSKNKQLHFWDKRHYDGISVEARMHLLSQTIITYRLRCRRYAWVPTTWRMFLSASRHQRVGAVFCIDVPSENISSFSNLKHIWQ